MTKSEAVKLVTILKAAYPRQPIERETLEVYATFLADLDWQIAEQAVKVIVSRSRFFPTVSELRETVAEAALQLPNEVEAWELVNAYVFRRPDPMPCIDCGGDGFTDDTFDWACKACNGTGQVYEPPVPLHEVICRALDYVGGAVAVREADHMAVVRAQFRDAYRTLRVQSVGATASGSLAALTAGPSRAELDQ